MKIKVQVFSLISLIATIYFMFVDIELAKVTGLLFIGNAILESK